MRFLFFGCLAILVIACSKDKVEGFSDGDDNCVLSFALKTDYAEHEVVLTRAVTLPTEQDFKVRIENTRAEVLREWKYADLPSLIKVVPGSYKLVAWHGSDNGFACI